MRQSPRWLAAGMLLAGPIAAGETGMGAAVELLPFRVTDAEYSSSLGKLVIVSTAPSNRIHVYDPEARFDVSASLPLAPMAVSVSPDGLHAAVGHDGWLSYVDVATATVLKTIPVTCAAADVVLAGNGYAYVFPTEDQWENIRCISIASGAETLGGGQIYDMTKAKLHPNGSKLYAANNGLSPSDIEKHNLSAGTSAYLYDSPYHGDYVMGGDLWIAEDGLRIFVRAGNVFRSSEVKDEDMIYNGQLSDLNTVEWLDHSSEAGKVLAIAESGSGGAPALQVYDYAFLAFEGSQAFPKVNLGGTDYATFGRFVFFEEDGKRAWAIVSVDPAGGLLFDHGIVPFTLEPSVDALTADVASVSVSAGGTQTLSLDAGPAHAGETYLVLGTTNGTSPGIPFQDVVIPLNFDFAWFYPTLIHPNQPPLVDTLALLDGDGRATAGFSLPAGAWPPALVGVVAHHAFVTIDAQGVVTFASNPTVLTLAP